MNNTLDDSLTAHLNQCLNAFNFLLTELSTEIVDI